MTSCVGIRELRQHASRYVDLAAGGQLVDITDGDLLDIVP